MIGGIDEAGRGPVFGPLVVAGVAGPDQELFRGLGVKDSKLLSPQHRKRLSLEVARVARRIETIHIPADEIDRRRDEETLNEIEVSAFAWVGRRLGVAELYVDAADVNEARFALDIHHHLESDGVFKIVSEHKADATYPVVSAASIVAKVQRDEEVMRLTAPLEKRLGLPFGSGYPTDPVTIAFLEAWLKRFEAFPPHTRRTWETARILKARMKTRRLDEDWSVPRPRPAPAPSPSR